MHVVQIKHCCLMVFGSVTVTVFRPDISRLDTTLIRLLPRHQIATNHVTWIGHRATTIKLPVKLSSLENRRQTWLNTPTTGKNEAKPERILSNNHCKQNCQNKTTKVRFNKPWSFQYNSSACTTINLTPTCSSFGCHFMALSTQKEKGTTNSKRPTGT